MTTLAQVHEAETYARKQRLALARAHLQADESKASADELKLIAKVKATLAGDGKELDRALASPAVGKLFASGVLRFGEAR